MVDKHPLQQLLEEAGYKCRSYSGRAMFGRRCLGVVCNAQQLGKLIANMLRNVSMFDDGEEVEEAATAMQELRWDNMGMDMIYYWPDVPYTDSPDEGETDE